MLVLGNRNDPCPCGSGLKWKKCTCKQFHPDVK
ncbi:SEC-C metal-binding domain-containing protein [Pseudoflavonifractor capillosus]